MTTAPTTSDHVERHRELRDGFRSLHRALPATMSAFGSLHTAALADAALSSTTKELIALAIGITSRCEGCVTFHVHDALQAGATRAEIEEAIGVAVLMGGGPAAVYGSEALAALDEFEAQRT
ncbi:MAG: carboxymuconolactone decarboxylase family protein [Actinomycetota bacterium]